MGLGQKGSVNELPKIERRIMYLLIKERVVVMLLVNGRVSFQPTSGQVPLRHSCTLVQTLLGQGVDTLPMWPRKYPGPKDP